LTQPELISQATMSMALWGECLIGKYRDGQSSIAQTGCLDPGLVQMGIDANGEAVYRYTHPYTGGVDELTGYDVVHAKLMVPLTAGPLRGLSPIRMCREGLGLNRALANYASAAASSGYRPDGVVTVSGPGAQDVLDNLEKGWEEKHAKPRRTAFVEGGVVAYTAVGMPPKDAEFMEQRNMSLLDTARIFGLPSWLLNAASGDSMTYSNSTQQWLQAIRGCFGAYAVAIESAITQDGELLPPGDCYCAFDFTSLLRGDNAERAAYLTAALNPETGWLTRAEAREIEGLGPEDEVTTAAPALKAVG
jgi:HK97 family phage portal protein